MFFSFIVPLFFSRANTPANEFSPDAECAPPVYSVIGRGPSSGCADLCFRGAVSNPMYPGFQIQNRHEVHDSIGWDSCLQRSGQAKLNEFQLPRMMSITASRNTGS